MIRMDGKENKKKGKKCAERKTDSATYLLRGFASNAMCSSIFNLYVA